MAMKIRMAKNSKIKIENLSERLDGIFLDKKAAEAIWLGKSNIILNSKKYKGIIDKPLYLVSIDKCYGVIKLSEPELIEDKKKLSGKKYIYSYKLDVLKIFEEPTIIKIPENSDFYVEDIEFLSDTGQTGQKAVIGTPRTFDPLGPVVVSKKEELFIKKKGDKWCVTHSNGTIIKCFPTKEEADKMHKAIVISKIKRGVMSEMPEFLNEFKDFKVIKDFISMVGSQVKNYDNHKPNDIDLQIRLSEPGSYLKRAVEVRVLKMLPEAIAKKIHFIWGDAEGAHDDFIPLYDLKLEKISPNQKITMHENEIELMRPYIH